MNPRLITIAGPLKGSVFPLPEGEWTIGRGAQNQLSLKDTGASREHCLFQRSGEQVVLRDLRSHNGTFVNGKRIGETELQSGAEIRIGASVFVFLTNGESAPPLHDFAPGSTIEMRIEDSLYLTSGDHALDASASPRAGHDMRLLLRLSTMLHSFRVLCGGQSQPAQNALSRHLISLLTDIIPAARGAVFAPSPDPAIPYVVLAQSDSPVQIDSGVFQRVAAKGIALNFNGEVLAAPVLVREQVEAVLYFQAPENRSFDEGHLQLLTAVAGMAAVAWENASMMKWLSDENDRLSQELKIEHGIVGDSAKLRDLQKQIARAAPSNATVLIVGESGTGKELIARAIHGNSPRAAGPFMAINCAALTETLLESELFGYEKGAFTGALAQRKGKLEAAAGGTVFLDEIGELPPSLQAKILRVLQERELQRVGGAQNIKLDIRLLAATNRDLPEMIKKGAFRQDLYYRLNVVTLNAPALRQRPEDILPLAEYFALKFAHQCGRKIAGISPQARAYLQSYSWPGNVRELENAMERAVVLGIADTILPEDLPENVREERPAGISATLYEDAVESAKRQVVLRAFEQAGHDHESAAKLLGLHPNYLHRLIRALDLRAALKAAARAH